jgi:hypothetical protein
MAVSGASINELTTLNKTMSCATPFRGAPCCLILDRGILGSKVRNIKMLIAVLVAGLTLAFSELGLGASDAEAATSCKRRYNLCLARCPGPFRRCYSRCQSQYRYCTYPWPYLGDVL